MKSRIFGDVKYRVYFGLQRPASTCPRPPWLPTRHGKRMKPRLRAVLPLACPVVRVSACVGNVFVHLLAAMLACSPSLVVPRPCPPRPCHCGCPGHRAARPGWPERPSLPIRFPEVPLTLCATSAVWSTNKLGAYYGRLCCAAPCAARAGPAGPERQSPPAVPSRSPLGVCPQGFDRVGRPRARPRAARPGRRVAQRAAQLARASRRERTLPSRHDMAQLRRLAARNWGRLCRAVGGITFTWLRGWAVRTGREGLRTQPTRVAGIMHVWRREGSCASSADAGVAAQLPSRMVGPPTGTPDSPRPPHTPSCPPLELRTQG